MSMRSLEIAEFRRGPGGRPTREEAERRHRTLMEAAARLFLERGLDGASVEAIAREAGVAKRFIYARYADKGELFIAAITRLATEQAATLQNFEIPPGPIEDGLFAFGRAVLDLVLKPDHIALFRTAIIESSRFPSLGGLDSTRSRYLGRALVLRVLKAYEARGEITLTDHGTQAELFSILVAVSARSRALIFGREPVARENRRLRAAIDLFLNGCRSPLAQPAARRRMKPAKLKTAPRQPRK